MSTATAPPVSHGRTDDHHPLVAIVADVHVGNHARYGGPVVDGLNRRGHETIDTLRRAVERAGDEKVRVFIVAGDLFHSARPEPALLRAVQGVFERARNEGMRVVLIPGNHDMPDDTAENGNTAMAPLYKVAEVVREPEWISLHDVGFLCVPYHGRAPMAQHLAELLVGKLDGKNVLVSHVGVFVEHETTPAWQRQAKDAISVQQLGSIIAKVGIDSAVVGNYHDPLTWRCKDGGLIYQVGTLCPHSFSDEGTKDRGRMVVISQSMGKLHFMAHDIPGPRFVDLVASWQVSGAIPLSEGYSAYGRLPPGEKAPEEMGKGWFALEEREVKAEEPLKYGGAPLGPQEALSKFVSEMALPEGSDRPGLLERVHKYWRAAS